MMMNATIFGMILYFMYASKSFEPAFNVGMVVVTSMFFVTFMIPESPKWLLSTGREIESIQAFKNIASLNNKTEPMITKLKPLLTTEESSQNHKP